MKKFTLFLLTLLIGVSFHTSIGHANETSVQNKAGITFTESSGEIPSDEENDSVQSESSGNKELPPDEDKGALPKTGEKITNILTLVGMIILVLFSISAFKIKKK